jgi:hypothetical protein
LTCDESRDTPVAPWSRIQRTVCDSAVVGGICWPLPNHGNAAEPSDISASRQADVVALWPWPAEIHVTGGPMSELLPGLDKYVRPGLSTADSSSGQSICVGGQRISDRQFGRTSRLQEVRAR